MTSFAVDLPFKPIPKGRPRVCNGRAYTPKRTKSFETDVGVIVRCKMNQLGIKKFKEGVSVCVIFNFKTTKETLVGSFNHTTTSDLDNLVKSVLDAMNGIVYDDDRQVFHIEAYKRWSTEDGVNLRISDGII